MWLLLALATALHMLPSVLPATQQPARPFSVVWNAPTQHCLAKWNVPIRPDLFGIQANTNTSFYGSRIVLFYEHELGLYPRLEHSGGKLVAHNGGVPQAVNMSRHLAELSRHIQAAMPDTRFDGLAVIDYESWYPIFTGNYGKRIVYKHYSISLVREAHPDWPQSRLSLHAKHTYDRAAKEFLLKTLNYAKMLRPKASWGFYGFPSCSNKASLTGHCAQSYQSNNDRLKYMFDASTALYPSVYLKEKTLSWPQEQRHAYIQAKLREAQRLRLKDTPQKIFVYTTYAYNLYEDNLRFYEKADLCSSLKQSADVGLSGVVLWGSWASASSRPKCKQLGENLSDLLGPYALLVTEMAAKCARSRCHGHGRCVLPMASQCLTISPLDAYSCECEPGFVPPDCAHQLIDYFNMGYSLGRLQRHGDDGGKQDSALAQATALFNSSNTWLQKYL